VDDGSAAAAAAAHRSGTIAGAAAYLLWGVFTVYWHELGGLEALGLIAWRVTWSVAILGVALTFTHRWRDLRPVLSDRRLGLRVVIASVVLAANWTTYVWCVTNDRVVETALGYFLAPIGLVVAGVVVYRERLSAAQRIALGLAVVAVVVLAAGYGAPPVFALILATTWTAYGMLKKTVPLPVLESLAAECLALAPFAIAMLAGMQVAGSGSLHGATSLQLWLVPLSGIVTTTPLLLFAHAAPRIPLGTLGWLQYSVPTINLALGVLVYGESMPAWRVAGFALVWVGLALISLDTLRTRRRSASLVAVPNA
jgi:chloramphenicol-sensitive protein RarD